MTAYLFSRSCRMRGVGKWTQTLSPIGHIASSAFYPQPTLQLSHYHLKDSVAPRPYAGVAAALSPYHTMSGRKPVRASRQHCMLVVVVKIVEEVVCAFTRQRYSDRRRDLEPFTNARVGVLCALPLGPVRRTLHIPCHSECHTPQHFRLSLGRGINISGACVIFFLQFFDAVVLGKTFKMLQLNS